MIGDMPRLLVRARAAKMCRAGDPVLVDKFVAKASEMRIDKNDAIDEALTLWLESKN